MRSSELAARTPAPTPRERQRSLRDEVADEFRRFTRLVRFDDRVIATRRRGKDEPELDDEAARRTVAR